MFSRRSMALSCSLLCLALACSDTPDTYTLNSRPKGDQLAIPTGLVATPGSGSVKLQWNPVSGATSYDVYRATGAATAPYALVANTGLTTYKDVVGYSNVLAAETPYHYRIMAKTNTGYDGTPTYIDSGLTDPVAATMTSVPAQNSQLAAPTVTLTDVNAVRFITWTEVPNATAYDVYVADTDQSFVDQSSPIYLFEPIELNLTGLVASHFVERPSTRYAYVVIARKSDNYYLPSPKSTLVFNDVFFRLSSPGSLAASTGTYADKIVVEWDKVPNATTYRVYRAESRTSTSPDTSTANVVSPFALVADLNTFTTSQAASTRLFVEDTANDLLPSSVEHGIAVNRYYWYKIQAVGDASWQDSFLTAAVQGTLRPDGQIPYSSIGTPRGVATVDDGLNAFITVRWEALLANATEPAAVSYDVYRSTDPNLGFVKIASAIPGTPVPAVANQLEYQDASAELERGAVYYYRIVARAAAAGLESDLSSAGGPGFVAGLDPFTAFTAVKDGSNDLLLTWSPIRNVNTGAGFAYSIRYVAGTAPPPSLITDGTTVLNVPGPTGGLNSYYFTGFSDAPFVAGTDYLFWVVATGKSGQQVASATVVVTR